MNLQWSRRSVLKGLAVASATAVVPAKPGAMPADDQIPSQPVEVQITPISPHTFRLSIVPVGKDGTVGSIPSNGSLVQEHWGTPVATLRTEREKAIVVGNLQVKISFHPLRINITNERGGSIQQFALDENRSGLSFQIGRSPLYGLGEGGSQFDRRGSIDLMRSGQGGYKLATHGGRVPIP